MTEIVNSPASVIAAAGTSVNQAAVGMQPGNATEAEMAVDSEFVGNKLGIGFYLSGFWIAAISLAALFAPWLPIKPLEGLESLGERETAPSLTHFFGTNANGKDMFALCIWGARTSLIVGFASITLGMLTGGTIGIVAGFIGGVFDKVSSFIILLLLSIPALILAIFILQSIGNSLFWITITIAILSIPALARLARAQTLAFAEREFVTASRALGAKNGRVMVREILPNVLMPLLALALLAMAIAIVAEGTLSFLGLGAANSSDSWGKLIFAGTPQTLLKDSPWICFAPILMIFLTVLSLNYLGDQVRRRFDVQDIPL